METTAEQMKIPLSVLAHRDRFAGLVARETDPDAVEPLLRRAIDGFTTWGSRPHRARAQADLGHWLREHGRVDEGEALLAEARGALADLGAHAWLAQTEGSPVRST